MTERLAANEQQRLYKDVDLNRVVSRITTFVVFQWVGEITHQYRSLLWRTLGFDCLQQLVSGHRTWQGAYILTNQNVRIYKSTNHKAAGIEANQS